MDSQEYNISGATNVRSLSSHGLSPEVEQWLHEKQIDSSILRPLGILTDGKLIGYPRYRMGGGPRVSVKWRNVVDKNTFFIHDVAGYKEAEALPLLWDRGCARLLLVEGESDFLRVCNQANVDVMCIPGSHGFNPAWLKIISQWDSVYAAPDPDAAGNKLKDTIAKHIPRCKFINTISMDLCDYLNSSTLSTQYVLDALMETARYHIPTDSPKKVKDFRNIYNNSRRRYENGEIERPDIVRVVQKLWEVDMHRTREGYKCRCQFHDDKTASFNINTQKQVYVCFGCGAGGDVYSFAMQWYETSFREAKEKVDAIR